MALEPAQARPEAGCGETDGGIGGALVKAHRVPVIFQQPAAEDDDVDVAGALGGFEALRSAR